MTDARETNAGAEAVVYAVPDDLRISVGAPSLIALPNGKLLAAFDQTGPDVKGLNGKKGHDAKRNRWMQGRVMASTDGGATGSWRRRFRSAARVCSATAATCICWAKPPADCA